MKLSEVPLEEIVSTPNWLIGLSGSKGTVVDIVTRKCGIRFKLFITIEWDSGNKSSVQYPDECGFIDINPEHRVALPVAYCNYKVEALNNHIKFYDDQIKNMIMLTKKPNKQFNDVE